VTEGGGLPVGEWRDFAAREQPCGGRNCSPEGPDKEEYTTVRSMEWGGGECLDLPETRGDEKCRKKKCHFTERTF